MPSFGTLHFGLKDTQVWSGVYDFGETQFDYEWVDSTQLKVRAYRNLVLSGAIVDPSAGTGRHFWWFDNSDPVPGNWYLRRDSVSGAANWASEVSTSVAAALPHIDSSYTGYIMLDNEHLTSGKYWQNAMQTQQPGDYGDFDKAAAHTAVMIPAFQTVLAQLQSDFPLATLYFYQVIHASGGNKTLRYLEKVPPESVFHGTGADDDYNPLIVDQGVMDGHSYQLSETISDLGTPEGKREYHRANLTRLKAHADANSVPLIASFWIHSASHLYGVWDHEAMQIFFEVLVELGIPDAVVLGDTDLFASSAALAGLDPGAAWREWVVEPAIDAGFLDPPGSTPPGDLTVSDVLPASGQQGATDLTLKISGSGFAETDVVTFSGTGITVKSSLLVGSHLEVVVDVDPGATLGARNVTVTSVLLGVGTLTGGFTVYETSRPAITVTRVDPDRMERGDEGVIAIVGTQFYDGVTVDMDDIVISNIDVETSKLLLVTVQVDDEAVLGARSVTVAGDADIPPQLEDGFAVVLESEGFKCEIRSAVGHDLTIVVRDESTWGEWLATSNDLLELEFASEQISNTIGNSDGRHWIFDTQKRAPEPGNHGRHDPGGSVVGEMQFGGAWPFLMRHALGEPSSGAGPGSTTQHVMVGSLALPIGFSLEKRIRFGSDTTYLRYLGCKVDKFFGRFSVGEIPRVRAAIIAGSETVPGVSAEIPTQQTQIRSPRVSATSIQMNIGAGLVPVGHIESIEFLIDNNLNGNKYDIFSGASRTGLPVGRRTVTGSMTAMFTPAGWQMYQRFRENGTVALKVEATDGDYLFLLEIPNARLRGTPAPQVVGGGPISVDFQWFGAYDATVGSDIRVTINSDDPSLSTISP